MRSRRLGRRNLWITLPPVLSLHEINRAIPDDRLQKGDELGDRAAPKLREAAGVKSSQRVGENVFRVGAGKSERSERPAADLLERREKGPPRLRIPALTASHQVEQVRVDRVLRRESIHGRPDNRSLPAVPDAAVLV